MHNAVYRRNVTHSLAAQLRTPGFLEYLRNIGLTGTVEEVEYNVMSASTILSHRETGVRAVITDLDLENAATPLTFLATVGRNFVSAVQEQQTTARAIADRKALLESQGA